jgi:hypothetical protein
MSTDLVPAVDAISAEIAQLEGEIGDPRSAYWSRVQGPVRQARYRSLLEAKEGGTAPPAIDARSTELLEIEAKMASSEYWRGPKVDGETALSRRYRALLEGETDARSDPAAGEGWRASTAVAKQFMDPALVQEWGQDFDANLRKVQNVAARIVGRLGDREAQVQFTGVFDGLAAPVQSAIFRELARHDPGYVRPADDADLVVFELACAGGGAAVIESWGSQARRRAGAALDRFQRVEKSLTGAALNQFAHFWKTSTPRERQLVLYSLGGS